jgi:uncharacterized protein (TIGR00725 family)
MTVNIAVLGSSGDIAVPRELVLAHDFARLAASEGYRILVGSNEGIMGAAAAGAALSGGVTVAILPVEKTVDPNLFTMVIRTGLGWGSFSQVLVNSCAAAVFVGGGAGSLIELCLCYLNGIPSLLLGGESRLAGAFREGLVPDARHLTEITIFETPTETLQRIDEILREKMQERR